MTLLSFIAIIASLLLGLWIVFPPAGFVNTIERMPLRKRICEKTLRFLELDMDDKPRWQRLLLKLLLSALVVTILGCGFYDGYFTLSPENRGFGQFLLIAFLTIASPALIIGICFTARNPMDALSYDYWGLESSTYDTSKDKIIFAANIAVIYLWLAVFSGGIWLSTSHSGIFAWISLSAILTLMLSFVLIIFGFACYGLFRILKFILINPVWHYIKWLLK